MCSVNGGPDSNTGKFIWYLRTLLYSKRRYILPLERYDKQERMGKVKRRYNCKSHSVHVAYFHIF